MEDLKTRIKTFLDEIESQHSKTEWAERVIAAGLDKNEVYVWAAEIGHVVEEYQSSLMRLADLLAETDVERIPRQVHSWAVGRIEVTIPEIEEPMRYLEGLVEKYIPPDPPDDEDELP